MPDTFTLTIDDREITDALASLSAKAADLSAPLTEIGELMVLSTKSRFARGSGPEGDAWAPNKPSTLDRWLEEKGGAWKKSGARSKRGEKLAAAKKPLVGLTKELGGGIHYQVNGHSLEWGTSEIQGNVMQFGAAKGAFGPRTPWGDIPARPFLGLSAADRSIILEIIGRHLLPA